MFRSVRPHLERAGITDPVVCYQGAVVADPRSGRFLVHDPIPLEIAVEAIAALDALGYSPNCYVDDEMYVAAHTPYTQAYAEFQNLDVTEVGDLRAWLSKSPTKLVAVGEPDALPPIRDELITAFDGTLFVTTSLPWLLELGHVGVSKGTGLAFVADLLGFAAEQTVAFGDGENDVELLEWAGYGVAVANAHARVTAVADLVCSSVDEEGVAQVIEALLPCLTR
jgi:hypothetical protein